MATKKKNAKRVQQTIPEVLNTPEFAATWAEWLQFTTDRGMPLARDAAARQLKLLVKLGPNKAIEDIRKTIQEHPLKDSVPDRATETAGNVEDAPLVRAAKGKNDKKSKEPKAKNMSALDAAAKVLEEKGEPMTCQEMIAAMGVKGYWTSPGGQTPAATLYSAILRETGKKGSEARFKKSERGKFVRA